MGLFRLEVKYLKTPSQYLTQHDPLLGNYHQFGMKSKKVFRNAGTSR